MDGQSYAARIEQEKARKENLAKLQAVDELHERELLANSFKCTQELLQDPKFIAIMRQVFEFTTYDVNTLNQALTPEEFQKLQGRREVWAMIREILIGNNIEALSLIENHKQINRRNNEV